MYLVRKYYFKYLSVNVTDKDFFLVFLKRFLLVTKTLEMLLEIRYLGQSSLPNDPN